MGYGMQRYKISRWFFLIGVATMLHAFPVPAAAEGLNFFSFKARYNLAWNGISVGRLVVVANEDASHYDMMIDSKARGLGALISDDKTVTRTNGIKTVGGEYLISHYEFRPQGKDKDDYITLDYDSLGKIVTRVRSKDDDPRWRPAVPHEEINTAHDPLTVIFMLRKKLSEALASKQPHVGTRTYDGMRLFEMKLNVKGKQQIEVMGSNHEVVEVAVERIPINGYTPKELKKYEKGDPEIHFYFSTDADFFPLKATADTGFGDLTLTLEKRE